MVRTYNHTFTDGILDDHTLESQILFQSRLEDMVDWAWSKREEWRMLV